MLAGLVDETSDLRRILIDGIEDNLLRAKVVAKVIAENDAALAALPADAQQRAELEQANFWNKRGLDKAMDDAEMLCHRLSYLDQKARALDGGIRPGDNRRTESMVADGDHQAVRGQRIPGNRRP